MAATEAEGKRGDILQAAQELFGRVGYEKTGVREIAELARVASATIYAHFGGKEAVLEAAVAHRLDRLVAHVTAVTGEDPLDVFLDGVRRLQRELLFVAGHETTMGLLSHGAERLAGDPALLERLRADRSLVNRFVEETLRTHAPLQRLFRVTTRDTELGGVAIRPAAWWWCSSARPTATATATPLARHSTSTPARPATWPSAWASTTAWAPRWPGWRVRWPST